MSADAEIVAALCKMSDNMARSLFPVGKAGATLVARAAVRIETLAAALADSADTIAALRKDAWISARERMPDEDSWWVLVFWNKTKTAFLAAWDEEAGRWWSDIGAGRAYPREEITHWMPLPAPPVDAAIDAAQTSKKKNG